jgi:hypothetical protein
MGECIRLGFMVDCISSDYTNSTVLPPEMRIHKKGGVLLSIQKSGIRSLTYARTSEGLKGVTWVEKLMSRACAAPSTL